jgi:hypothetical protein
MDDRTSTRSGLTEGAAKTEREAPKQSQTQFKIADVRATDVTLELDDGRVFLARIGDNIAKDELKRGRLVTIKSDGMDKSDAPKDAEITRLLPKD